MAQIYSVFSVYFVSSNGQSAGQARLVAQATDVTHDVTGPAFEVHKRLDIRLGRIIDVNELKRTDGVTRLIVPGANLN